MPEEKIELLDDFLVDMDIETITIDKNDERVFLETEELDEEEIENTSDIKEFSKATGVEIENLNISGGGITGAPSDIKAETINIYQQSAAPSINQKESSSGVSSKASETQASQSVPQPKTETVDIPQQSFTPSINQVESTSEISSQAIETPVSQSISQASVVGANVPPNIIFENVTFEIKDANIKVGSSEIKTEDLKFSTKDSEIPTDVSDLLKEPEEELITISETDLNEIIDENTVDLDKLAEETESEFSSSEGLIDTEEITDKIELDDTISEIEKVEEPVIPEEAELTPMENYIEKNIEEPKGMTEEDSIVSIDGNELDNLIYGGELSKYMEESSPKQEIKLEEPVKFAFTEPEESYREKTETKDIIEFDEAGFDNIDEIKLEEIPLEDITIPTESSKEIPIVEEIPQEDNIISKAEEETEILISPESLREETSIEDKKEENFTFDLSVIPDVAEVEEDEPIALSLEELNNIEVSEENIEERLSSVENENIEIPVEELANNVELSLKEPASLEIYSTEETEGLPEGIEIEGIDNLFEEPEPVKSFSESANIIEDKLESLSPETKEELKTVLKYLDNLLEELPEDKIKEFAKSEYYDLYVKILDKLGI